MLKVKPHKIWEELLMVFTAGQKKKFAVFPDHISFSDLTPFSYYLKWQKHACLDPLDVFALKDFILKLLRTLELPYS
jgi:hypothetical protein